MKYPQLPKTSTQKIKTPEHQQLVGALIEYLKGMGCIATVRRNLSVYVYATGGSFNRVPGGVGLYSYSQTSNTSVGVSKQDYQTH